MSDANRTALNYRKNSVALGGALGTYPTNPALKKLYVANDGLRGAPRYAESSTIVASARVKALRRVGIEASGSLGLEFIYGNVDELLEGLFFSTWQRTPQRFNAAADQEIADVVAATGVITILAAAAGNENRVGTFGVGHLVRAEGFTNPGNNFLKRVTAATGTSLTVSTTGLVNETAPPQGARLKAVGIEAPAAGNIAATTSGLAAGASGAITGTGVDFVALGMVAGMWFKASGFTGTAANNGWYRALSVAAGRIECDIVPSGFAPDAAGAVQIRLWLPDYLRDGQDTVVWYDFERQLPDLAVPEYDSFISMLPVTWGLDLSPQGILGCSVDFVGANFANSTTRPGGTPTDVLLDPLGVIPRSGEPFDTSSNVATIREGAAALPAALTQVGFSIANGGGALPVIGQLGAGRLTRARFRPSATLRSYYLANTLRAKLLNDTLTGLQTVLTDPNGTRAFVIDYPSGKFTEGNLEGIQVDSQRQLPLTFQAVEHVAYNCAAQLMRFAEFA
ncbi:MAG: phage tail tube protein [Vicinamibacterales bacterium]